MRCVALGSQVACPAYVLTLEHVDMSHKCINCQFHSQLVTLSPPLEMAPNAGHESDGPRELPMALGDPVEFTLTIVP